MTIPEPDDPPLVLASASRARAAMLRAAGLGFVAVPAAVDEAGLFGSLRAEGASPRDTAIALAEIKALTVSRGRPNRLVIGADQVLACDEQLFQKAADRAAAAETLRALRGRWHELIAAAAVARDGQVIWRQADSAKLLMRDFSEAFLADYLDRAGPALSESVGAYHLEGLGAQLFERIEGDHFTVRGLPLLALLRFLRGHGVIAP